MKLPDPSLKFLKKYITGLSVLLVHMCTLYVQCSQRPEGGIGYPGGPELQTDMSHNAMLGIESRSSGQVDSAFDR